MDDNCCVYLGRDMHYYSVPYKYIGFRMQVVFTATVVKIYTPDGMLVREWDRDRTPGAYSTKQEDMASNSQAYRQRSPAYYISRSRDANENLGIVVETMFCLTSLVSMPYVLTDAHISLLTVPSRANALASLRQVVKMIS